MFWLKASSILHQSTKENSQGLLKDSEAPLYMREESITSGYRKKLSYSACVVSYFFLHNETFNIWSHFIGFVIFFYLWILALFYPPPTASTLDMAPITLQLMTYQICMISSALFHTFSCHSEKTHRSWQATDHFGIIWAMFGTYVPFLCQAFDCHFEYKIFHLAVVCIMVALVLSSQYSKTLARFTMKDSTKCPKSGGLQLYITLIVACYFLVPLCHWIWLYGGLQNKLVLRKLQEVIVPWGFGAFGFIFYLSRYPEKLWRKSGIFDIFGASHQVWHVMIFLGMFFWYYQTYAIAVSSNDHHERESGCVLEEPNI